jgi:hypothetical protein
MRFLALLLVLVFCVLGGCSDDTDTTTDAGLDAAVEVGIDAAEEATVPDGPGGDLPELDGPEGDAQTTDQGGDQ